MAIAVTEKEFEYVLEADRDLPAEQQTTWILKVLNWDENRQLEKSEWKPPTRRGAQAVMVTDPKAIQRRALDLGLLGWRNFKSRDGTAVEFRRDGGKVPGEVLDMIAPYAAELANAIADRAIQTPEDVKN
jgi:hypothetical protein